MNKFLNHFITRLIGFILIIGGFALELKFSYEAINGLDMLLILLLIVGACLISNSWEDIKRYFGKNIEDYRNDMANAPEEWEAENDDDYNEYFKDEY